MKIDQQHLAEIYINMRENVDEFEGYNKWLPDDFNPATTPQTVTVEDEAGKPCAGVFTGARYKDGSWQISFVDSYGDTSYTTTSSNGRPFKLNTPTEA